MTSRFPAAFQPASRGLAGSDLFSELHREMNRLLEDFAGVTTPGQGLQMAAPRLDVRENEQEICVCAELPGVRPEAVDVRVDGNLLTLRGEKQDESRQKQEDYLVLERSFGRFQRSLQLPFAPDPDQVRAEFAHGVLTVHLPKQLQHAQSRRIEIQSPPGAGGGSRQKKEESASHH